MTMALPINTTPIYSLTIPSNGDTVKFRPFLVREEKALLIAQQSEDPEVMVDTLKEVIKSCVKDVDVNKLAIFDLEYIFTQLRGKSVGETIDLIFPCDVCVDDKAKIQITFDITKIEVEKTADHNKNIKLFEDVGIVMKYPTIQILKQLQELKVENLEEIFNIVAECVDYIYEGDDLYYSKELSKTEILEFLNNLTSEQFKNVQTFFETMPRLKKEVDYNCPVCKKAHHKVLEGLNSFF
jgi:hypothetical protein